MGALKRAAPTRPGVRSSLDPTLSPSRIVAACKYVRRCGAQHTCRCGEVIHLSICTVCKNDFLSHDHDFMLRQHIKYRISSCPAEC